jgi:tetratricopeptide (TPR) repeat protein
VIKAKRVDTQSVIKAYFQQIKVCPNCNDFYFKLGQSFLDCGEMRKAFKAYLKGIECGGDSIDNLLYWANLMYNSSLFLEAGRLYSLALSYSSVDPTICYKLASCLRSTGDIKEAQALEVIAQSLE